MKSTTNVIAQGAEAVLIRRRDHLIKERIKKGYRISDIDERLRKERTRHEVELMRKARRAGALTPHVFKADNKTFTIDMQFINGKMVKDVLDTLDENTMRVVCEEIGRRIARLHDYNIIHGDLTTSNMILHSFEGKEGSCKKGGRFSFPLIYFIDFGLGFHSNKIEDKAVDLYLLYGALKSSHKKAEKAWRIILNAYKENSEEADKIIKRLTQIEKRGRYRKR